MQFKILIILLSVGFREALGNSCPDPDTAIQHTANGICYKGTQRCVYSDPRRWACERNYQIGQKYQTIEDDKPCNVDDQCYSQWDCCHIRR
ncbi:hypothetical protein PTTW11_10685 [Pyrenophora teres f. teres]|uniref:Uncharacterized protein n=1 Tax=Pyrenophora teres f. teres TaxID=97479 RepID=A0A6S6WE90_9PLEO|nr:hypothetical protein PTTW11_10685 [Pyrenophora teres f. teres]